MVDVGDDPEKRDYFNDFKSHYYDKVYVKKSRSVKKIDMVVIDEKIKIYEEKK